MEAPGETRPRDLTSEELEIANAPATRSKETAPSRLIPGTRMSVERLAGGVNPSGPRTQTRGQSRPQGAVPPSSGAAATAPPSAPTQGPPTGELLPPDGPRGSDTIGGDGGVP
jgi:hypothetical protein